MGKLVALLTDYGVRDAYVSSVKAVIKSVSPDTEIIDITHEILPQNVEQAAYVLWSVYKYFPAKTIFVAVVDPGVGSKRDIMILDTGKYTFIAPDNGLLKFVMADEKIKAIYNVSNEKYFLKNISNTFHGRDIFAPIAGNIANGIPLKKIGPTLKPQTRPEYFISLNNIRKKEIDIKVVNIDRFGNVITNLFLKNSQELYSLDSIILKNSIIKNFHLYYEAAKENEIFGLIGSTNLLEISMNKKSAAEKLKIKIGINLLVKLK